RFSTTPGGKDLMMGFEPRGSTVTVQDDDGDDVLDGDIPDDSVDPNAIRCCLSEDSGGGDGDDDQGENQGNGAECEELTADECMTQGGQNLGAGTCLPDPCEIVSGTQGDQVQCCVPDSDPEDTPECEQRTSQECSQVQGIDLGAGSCDPNPCEAIPP